MPKFINLQDTIDHQVGRMLFKAIQKPAERILALDRLNYLYDIFQKKMDMGIPGNTVFDTVLDLLDVQYDAKPHELEQIPKQGPLVVVANHPFGAIEGVIAGSLLLKIRTDIRILGNYLLNRVVGIRDYIIAVDPFESDGIKKTNLKGLKQSLAWLKQGNGLVTFPAGEVASYQPAKGRVVEPAWASHIGALVRLSKATVLPIYFPGRNSFLFMLMGLLHPRLRTAMLIRELLNKTGKRLTVHIGSPVSWQYLSRYSTDEGITECLRLKTEILRVRDPRRHLATGGLNSRIREEPLPQPLIEPVPRSILKKEIGHLPKGQLLVQRGDFSVYLARSAQIPYLMNEIGRLREYTYRDVQEGTGRSLDLDRFDAYYLHLFLWNQATSELIGAYRMGLVDQILKMHGQKGLYTSTLFRFEPGFMDQLGGAIEFGRSFVRPEYQKKFNSLILIWRGIGEFIRRNPRYRTLFGPVSISSDYHAVSKSLLVKFLKEKRSDDGLSSFVSARHPFRPPRIDYLDEATLQASIRDVEDISFLISEIEKDGKGVPVLLKHYLKLNGKLLSFNVDKSFSNVVDGLLFVDLRETDPKILNRFIGAKNLSPVLSRNLPEDYKADTSN
ncbi:MAG: lysophospholipid acyltransferase family protein [Deltaproteobacteria bacterium]|nr:lysophospholipid acyltransferase family protein [Deltaproteobacteria bacterium]